MFGSSGFGNKSMFGGSNISTSTTTPAANTTQNDDFLVNFTFNFYLHIVFFRLMELQRTQFRSSSSAPHRKINQCWHADLGTVYVIYCTCYLEILIRTIAARQTFKTAYFIDSVSKYN